MDDDAANEILCATHRALCTHGYADLTLKHIAAETDKSKAAIHYYYDSKAALFTAFLGHLYEQYADRIESISGDCPLEHLQSLLDELLATGDESPDEGIRTAMVEVRAQAPYDDGIRTQLTRFDEVLAEEIRTILQDGIDDGSFDESVDPELTAEFLTATISGAHTRHVAVGYSMDRVRDATRQYVETRLVAETTKVTP